MRRFEDPIPDNNSSRSLKFHQTFRVTPFCPQKNINRPSKWPSLQDESWSDSISTFNSSRDIIYWGGEKLNVLGMQKFGKGRGQTMQHKKV